MTTSKTVFMGLDELQPEGVLEGWDPTASGVRPSAPGESKSSSRQPSVWTRVRSTFAAGGFVLVLAAGSTDAGVSPIARPVTGEVASRTATVGELSAQAGMWATKLYLAARGLAEDAAHPPHITVEDEPPSATVELALPAAWVGVVLAPAAEESGWYLARREADDSLTRDSGPLSTLNAEAVVRRALA